LPQLPLYTWVNAPNPTKSVCSFSPDLAMREFSATPQPFGRGTLIQPGKPFAARFRRG
jgi:hypothetical protein